LPNISPAKKTTLPILTSYFANGFYKIKTFFLIFKIENKCRSTLSLRGISFTEFSYDNKKPT
jgi:hypothetical protein